MQTPPQEIDRAAIAAHWLLDPSVAFLNHGSFGACPREVLDVQRGWRDRLESEPVRFLTRELEDLLDWARSELAAFVGADGDDLAFLPNATSGVSTVVRSVRFEPGDEIVTTDHAYNATLNALRFAAARDGAAVKLARLPFPLASPTDAVEAILAAVGPRTRLVTIDHVTSPTAIVLPVAEVQARLDEQGVDLLVDGAHAPGMVPLELSKLGSAYYAATAHKWICAPKGTAFLHVRRDRQERIHPLPISHGANDTRTDRSRFRLEFDWPGTFDPSGFLAIPAAIDGLGELLPGGWPALRSANRTLALAARDMLCSALRTSPPVPDEMIGSMASVRLPGGPWPRPEATRRQTVLEAGLRQRGLQVPLMLWPCPWLVDAGDLPPDTRFELLVRVSAQLYNQPRQYERLASVLADLTGATHVLGDAAIDGTPRA